MEHETGLNKALEIFQGSPSKLAAALDGDVKRQNVEHWVKTGVVPAERCPAIEEATGGLVRCEDLRPDVRWDVLRTNTPLAQAQSAQAATENVAEQSMKATLQQGQAAAVDRLATTPDSRIASMVLDNRTQALDELDISTSSQERRDLEVRRDSVRRDADERRGDARRQEA